MPAGAFKGLFKGLHSLEGPLDIGASPPLGPVSSFEDLGVQGETSVQIL